MTSVKATGDSILHFIKTLHQTYEKHSNDFAWHYFIKGNIKKLYFLLLVLIGFNTTISITTNLLNKTFSILETLIFFYLWRKKNQFLTFCHGNCLILYFIPFMSCRPHILWYILALKYVNIISVLYAGYSFFFIYFFLHKIDKFWIHIHLLSIMKSDVYPYSNPKF